ncbi:MAG: 2-amino-4-hydroxy-6-hydroxymethyldihydropteridine diphosphokinase [Bacteroidetes bacterium]|nr:2-amino-4-hydroxy-6-hydroxymethyldihydropteridine diphosphokinase [Bacteroidota bacterium]
MNTAYVLLGGNKGERLTNIEKAISFIEKLVGPISNKSKIYVTAAWGNTNQPDFYNQVICVSTKLSAIALLEALLLIENKLGRQRGDQKWQARTIDLDILFFNNDIIDSPDLKVPHPYLHERKFTLVPLAEIAANFVHPIFNKSIAELENECSDELEVNPLM